MTTEIGEKALLKKLAELPREREPENDAWPGILARIQVERAAMPGPKAGFRWQPMAVAAALFIAFGVGFLLGPAWFSATENQPDKQQLASKDERSFEFPTTLVATLAATELEYQAAFKEFISVGRSRDGLAPATVETLLMSWEEMRKSEAALGHALQAHPENAFLNTKMLELRSRQLQFLQQIAALDHNSKRTTI